MITGWPERFITISEPITMAYEVTAGGFALRTVSHREIRTNLKTGETLITYAPKEKFRTDR